MLRSALLGMIIATFTFAPTAHAGLTPATNYSHLFSAPGIVEVEGFEGQWVWFAEIGGGTGRLMGFDPSGTLNTFQTTVTPIYTDPAGEWGTVRDVAWQSDGDYIYVATSDRRVIRYLRTMATPPADAVFYADDGGTIGTDETPVQTPMPLGGPVSEGTGNGQFGDSGPGQIALFSYWVDDSEVKRVAVTDPSNARVQLFDENLNYVSQFSHPDWEFETNEPTAIEYNWSNSQILVAESGSNVVRAFDNDGSPSAPDLLASGPVVDLVVNSGRGVIYAATDTQIDVFGSVTSRYLGSFPESDIGAGQIGGISQYGGTLYLTDLTGGTNDTARSYSLDAAPDCENDSDPVDVVAGQTIQLTGTCTDPDGSTNFDILPSGTEGAYEKGEGSYGSTPGTFAYTAYSDQLGLDWACYEGTSLNGTSGIRCRRVNIVEPPPPPPPAPPITPAANEPTYKLDSNLSRSTGTILVQLPGTNTFVPLEKDMVVPLGTVVDATNGVAVVTWARPDGSTYSAKFWAGVFEIRQTTGSDPIGEVKLRDDLVKKAAQAKIKTSLSITSAAVQFDIWIAAKKKKGKRKNKVWGDGKGKFRSSGSNSSASVRGTVWLVENFVNATRTFVKSGIVDVRDKRKKKTIRLRKGKSYTAYRR